MNLHFSKVDTPVGVAFIVADELNVHALTFHKIWPGYLKHQEFIEERDSAITSKTSTQLREYFDQKRRDFDVPYVLDGTDFQKAVWSGLAKIPFGETQTYGQQAAALGRPSAVRAVGGTNGRNPLSVILPCHRVIGANGSLTGYAGGLEVKQYLLRLEGHQV